MEYINHSFAPNETIMGIIQKYSEEKIPKNKMKFLLAKFKLENDCSKAPYVGKSYKIPLYGTMTKDEGTEIIYINPHRLDDKESMMERQRRRELARQGIPVKIKYETEDKNKTTHKIETKPKIEPKSKQIKRKTISSIPPQAKVEVSSPIDTKEKIVHNVSHDRSTIEEYVSKAKARRIRRR